MSVVLRPHNKRAYTGVTNRFNIASRAAVIHPTGTGKTYIGMALIEDNPNKKVLYLSPSTSIMHQLKRDLIANNVDFRNLTRCTYQKLTALNRNGELDLEADIIILDEFHHCGAPEWGKAVEELLRKNPNAKVLGLSATPMRYFDDEIRDMAEELFEGAIVSEISLEEAIAEGILREPVYTVGLYEKEKIANELEQRIEKSSNSENKKLAQREFEKLRKLLNSAVEGLPELLEKSMTNKNGKYIVYCRNIDDMKAKMDEASKIFGRVNSNMNIRSVASNQSDLENERTIKEFENDDADGTLNLLFAVDMLNEGYHLKDLDGVVMMRPTHSPTLYYQQYGRASSVCGEKQPIVIDLVDNIDSIKIIEHLSKRIAERKREVKTNSEIPEFGIAGVIKQIEDIVERIDTLVKRNYTTIEEKLAVMFEYIQTTGESIKRDTVYNGYNIGFWQINLRSSFNNGTLNVDEETLSKLIESGIIKEEKERKRYSREEKYEFLMAHLGKTKAEMKALQESTGLSFSIVRSEFMRAYENGTLKLSEEKINRLIEEGFIGCKLPFVELKNVILKYGSYSSINNKDDIVVLRECVGQLSKDQRDGYVELMQTLLNERMTGETCIRAVAVDDMIKAALPLEFANVVREMFGLDGTKKSITQILYENASNKNFEGYNEEQFQNMILNALRKKLIDYMDKSVLTSPIINITELRAKEEQRRQIHHDILAGDAFSLLYKLRNRDGSYKQIDELDDETRQAVYDVCKKRIANVLSIMPSSLLEEPFFNGRDDFEANVIKVFEKRDGGLVGECARFCEKIAYENAIDKNRIPLVQAERDLLQLYDYEYSVQVKNNANSENHDSRVVIMDDERRYQILMAHLNENKTRVVELDEESKKQLYEIRRSLRTSYDEGTLNLTEEQVETLREEGFIGCEIESRTLFGLIENYGSYSSIQGDDALVVIRGDKRITKSQRDGYVNLMQKVMDGRLIDETCINAAGVDKMILETFTNQKTRDLVKDVYGIGDTQKTLTEALSECDKESEFFGMSEEAAESNIINTLRNSLICRMQDGLSTRPIINVRKTSREERKEITQKKQRTKLAYKTLIEESKKGISNLDDVDRETRLEVYDTYCDLLSITPKAPSDSDGEVHDELMEQLYGFLNMQKGGLIGNSYRLCQEYTWPRRIEKTEEFQVRSDYENQSKWQRKRVDLRASIRKKQKELKAMEQELRAAKEQSKNNTTCELQINS